MAKCNQLTPLPFKGLITSSLHAVSTSQTAPFSALQACISVVRGTSLRDTLAVNLLLRV